MSVIDKIELYYVSVPLPAPFRPSWVPGFTQHKSNFYLVRLTTDDGVEGWSSMSSNGPEKVGLGQHLESLLMGIDPTDIALVRERLKMLSIGGNRNMWVEPACWDIKGKLAGKPVYELLGGKAQPITLYASSGEVLPVPARVDDLWRCHEEGFRTYKIRIHDFDEQVDIREVQEPAKALAGKLRVSVDVNQAYRSTLYGDQPVWDLARAKRFADACADVDVAWIEEPLCMEWYADMAALTAYSKVPITGAEVHTQGLAEIRHMIERRCYHIYQSDAMWAGGISDMVEVADLCRQHGAIFNPHTWSNGIGFAVNMHVALAGGFIDKAPLEYPLSRPGFTAEVRDAILTQPWTHKNGVLQPPVLPGLGFEIDQDALSRFGKCFFRADRQTRHWMPDVFGETRPSTPA